MSRIARLIRDEEATTAVEYAVMLAMILIACIGAVAWVGQSGAGSWSNSASQLQGVMGS